MIAGTSSFQKIAKLRIFLAQSSKNYSHAKTDKACGFVFFGYKSDKAGDDDKERPPTE